MSFQVTTSALRAGASRLQGLGEDSAQATTYASTHLHMDTSEAGALFQHVDNTVRAVGDAVEGVLATLRTVLESSGRELTAVARDYDRTDAGAAADADRLTPRVAETGTSFGDHPQVPDTVPENPSDYQPADEGDGDDDGEVLMAPGPLGQPSGGGGMLA